MKTKLLLAFLIAGFQTLIFGQTNIYHPFPDSAATWKVSCGVNADPCYGTWTYNYILTGGDTIIGTYQYKKIYSQLESCSGPNPCYCDPNSAGYVLHYYAAIRNDTIAKKVFIALNGIDSMLYDFNLNLGDTLRGANTWLSSVEQCPSTVSSIDSVLCGSHYRKRWITSISNCAIIEGIGSTFGIFSPICPPFESGCDLNCFSQNNVTLYGNGLCEPLFIKESNTTPQIKISPNPTAHDLTISILLPISEAISFTLYNPLGQAVKEMRIADFENQEIKMNVDELPAGLYLLLVKAHDWARNEKVMKIE